MKVSVFGSGYVGLVTANCFAHAGHQVCCIDHDEGKIRMLRSGQIPIFEPGLEEIVKANQEAGSLVFSKSAEAGIDHGEVIFIAVGTPTGEDGSADVKNVLQVAESIGKNMNDHKIVVAKSTVPVGSCDKISEIIRKQIQARGETFTFDVASNPEFLKEGSAVSDFQRPDRIVVGTDSDLVRTKFTELYAPFNRNHNKLVFMDVRSSELTKYAANAMLATKISFMNEIANLADRVGADIENVRLGIGSDSRIGYNFIYAGCGYGGSCFPKDIRALKKIAEQNEQSCDLLNAVETVNTKQKNLLFSRLCEYFKGSLSGKVIAVWGLSFKPNTDDIREAPSLDFLREAFDAGASVQAYDPKASDGIRQIFLDESRLTIADTKEAALENADALVVCTEWQCFKAPNYELMRNKLNVPLIIDGRNLYDPVLLRQKGIEYIAVGRNNQRLVA
tara:strand:- start:81 stop:1421 length:1341 start_codon:yes stop_codon:yes gene_type:complete